MKRTSGTSGTISRGLTLTYWDPRGERERIAVQKQIFKGTMATRFPNLTTDINLKIQAAQQTPNRKAQGNPRPYPS